MSQGALGKECVPEATVASREPHHQQIVNQLKQLDDSIDRLQMLIDKIAGNCSTQPVSPEKEQLEYTLQKVLQRTPEQLHMQASTIHDMVNTLEDLLF